MWESVRENGLSVIFTLACKLMRVIDYNRQRCTFSASLFSHLFSLHISGCPCSPPGSAPETRAGQRAPGWSPPCPPAVGAGGGSPRPWWICQRSSGCSWWGFPQPPARTAWSAPLHFWLATDLQNKMEPWNQPIFHISLILFGVEIHQHLREGQ